MRISDWSSDVCSSIFIHQAAVAHARGELLAHVAALVPVDALQLVEAALPQGGLLDRQVAAAVGHAGGAPASVVAGEGSGTEAGNRKSVVQGTVVSVRGDIEGARIIQKKKKPKKN